MDLGFEGEFSVLRASLSEIEADEFTGRSHKVNLPRLKFDNLFACDVYPKAQAAWTHFFSRRNKVDDVYHPGAIYYQVTPAYSPGYHGNFGGFYGHATEVAYQQPVWTANVSHAMISDLYVARTQARVWQAVSETIESSSTSQVIDDAIDALIGNLKEKGLLN